MSRASNGSTWRLQRAWRTNQSDGVIEVYGGVVSLQAGARRVRAAYVPFGDDEVRNRAGCSNRCIKPAPGIAAARPESFDLDVRICNVSCAGSSISVNHGQRIHAPID